MKQGREDNLHLSHSRSLPCTDLVLHLLMAETEFVPLGCCHPGHLECKSPCRNRSFRRHNIQELDHMRYAGSISAQYRTLRGLVREEDGFL